LQAVHPLAAYYKIKGISLHSNSDLTIYVDQLDPALLLSILELVRDRASQPLLDKSGLFQSMLSWSVAVAQLVAESLPQGGKNDKR